ncbi:MAG: hypothetical protein LBI14_05625 [Treponema sp.]|jgi:hypothetical protein|nr:hypothetical protein [Treponema sp.]
MITPAYTEFSLHPIKSCFTQEATDPTSWIDEFEKSEYPYNEIISVIEFYEFIIACIIKAMPFLEDNESLLDKVNTIFKERYNTFAQEHFKEVKFYESLLTIIRFINLPPQNRKYGLCDTVQATQNFYKYLMMYIEIVFGDTCNDYIFIHDELKKSKRKTEIKNLNELLNISKGIKCPKLKYFAINNLLGFFERKKKNYNNAEKSIIQAPNYNQSNNIQDNSNNKLLDKIFSIFSQYALNLGETINETNSGLKHIYSTIRNESYNLETVIIEEGEKTRELIINKAFEISNEIMNCYSSIPPEYRGKCAEKLWMIARHPEFIEPLGILILNGFIKEEPKNYKFDYKTKKGFGYNILAYCISQYADLRKWADYPGSKNKKNDEHESFYTKRVYEPFSIAFDIKNLENNIRDKNIPKEYYEFIEKSGLKECKTWKI